MDDIRTRGWFLARLELAMASIAVLLMPIMMLTSPVSLAGPDSGRDLVRVLPAPIVGEALAIAGLVWMLRIWRGPTRDAPPEWRYRR